MVGRGVPFFGGSHGLKNTVRHTYNVETQQVSCDCPQSEENALGVYRNRLPFKP
uniref:Uncharacterized protein n=1 Tax=Physcomitrium patens TaxID=3218 RepID=A0A2K1JU22_PHYPA|nr:hypothetical protein PHYPA_014789 [Physcomitrium patens]